MFKRIISSIVCICFILSNFQLAEAQELNLKELPIPGKMLLPASKYVPLSLKGLIIHPENALKFDFLLDTGNTHLTGSSLKEESLKVMKYFLTALTIPEEDMWVNLSPYEKGRIVESNFGSTLMGRDLLAEDYILKQLTASVIYPEDELGKKFWAEVYAKANKELGASNIAVNTFNKVWIVPSEAIVWEHSAKVMIVKSSLKVMLEEDYLAMSKNVKANTHSIGSQAVRDLVIPLLEKQVNEGEHFAQLRQMYQAMILATWYKKSLKQSVINKVYANQKKTKGIDEVDSKEIEGIYQKYLLAFKKGAFNYIKEDFDPATRQAIPRKYFSGGFNATRLAIDEQVLKGDFAQLSRENQYSIMQASGNTFQASWQADKTSGDRSVLPQEDRAMLVSTSQILSLAFLGIGLPAYLKWRNNSLSGILFSEKGAVLDAKLNHFLSKKQTKDLVLLLDHKKWVVRKWAAHVLGTREDWGATGAIAKLRYMFKDSNLEVRKSAAEALMAMHWFPETIEDQVAYYLAVQSWHRIGALGKDAEPALVEALNDENIEFKKQVIHILGIIHDQRAIQPLLVLLSNKRVTVDVKLEVAQAIIDIDGYEHKDILIKLLKWHQFLKGEKEDIREDVFLFLNDVIRLKSEGYDFKFVKQTMRDMLGFGAQLSAEEKKMLEQYWGKDHEGYLDAEVSLKIERGGKLSKEKIQISPRSIVAEQTVKDLSGETEAELIESLRNKNAGVRKSSAEELKKRNWQPQTPKDQMYYYVTLGDWDQFKSFDQTLRDKLANEYLPEAEQNRDYDFYNLIVSVLVFLGNKDLSYAMGHRIDFPPKDKAMAASDAATAVAPEVFLVDKLVDYLRSIGFREETLAYIKANRKKFSIDVENNLKPKIAYLSEIGVQDIPEVLQNSPELIQSSVKDFKRKLDVLKAYKVKDIASLIQNFPVALNVSLEDKLEPTLIIIQEINKNNDIEAKDLSDLLYKNVRVLQLIMKVAKQMKKNIERPSDLRNIYIALDKRRKFENKSSMAAWVKEAKGENKEAVESDIQSFIKERMDIRDTKLDTAPVIDHSAVLRQDSLVDGAMVSSPGGIDLNSMAFNLQINRDDNNVPVFLNFQPQDLIDFSGFVPTIIEIKSVDLPALLGVSV